MDATHEDFAADAHRLAMELECLLLSTKDTAALSRWWDSAHEALEQHRQLVRDTLEQPEQRAECDGGTCGLGGYCDECPKRQTEQEPVAWMWEHQLEDLKHYGFLPNMRAWTTERRTGNFESLVPVYTHPPRCSNCASLEEQNTYLDRKLAESELHLKSTPPPSQLRRLTDDEIAVIWFHARLPGVTETAARMLIRAAEGKLRDIA